MIDVRTALLQGQKLLEDAGVGAPRLTAEVLLMHAAGQERAWLYAHSTDELREVWWIHYGRYLHERINGKPTQYITGHQEFYGRDFRVSPNVLIPRPETEHLVEAALNCVNTRLTRDATRPLAVKIVDIGTGSGAIAVTLALELSVNIFATDISANALAVAAGNARQLNANVQFIAGDLCEALANETFDVVVSNPPYVLARDRDSLQREVRDFEPSLALFGGDNGLDVYRRLIPDAQRVLRPEGWLLLELGSESLDPVRDMLRLWNHIEVISDLAGIPRVILAQKPPAQKL